MQTPEKRGSGKSAGQPTRITRTRNGLSEGMCSTHEVLVHGAEAELIRARETVENLMAGEKEG